jgi:DNA polymerase elongation subunit (family B)
MQRFTNPLLRNISFRKATPASYTRERKFIQFQLLSYDSSDKKPTGILKYDLDMITTNGDFYCQAKVVEEEIREDTHHWLQLYGRTIEGFSVALHVEFWPTLMICLPDNWNARQCRELLSHLCQKRRIPKGCVLGEVKFYHRLSGFFPDLKSDTPKLAKFPFLQIQCRSKSYMKLVCNFFKFTDVSVCGVHRHRFEYIEQDIPPILQLLELCNGRPSGVLEVDTKDLQGVPGGRLTHCDLEFQCIMKPFMDECPIRSVEIDTIFPIVILSFDIECLADNPNVFPDPEKDHPVVCICSTVKNLLTGEVCIASHTLGDHTPVNNKGVVHQFRYHNEGQLLEEWRDFLLWVDPDITTGYNIHRFDWPYLNTRMENINRSSRFFFISRLVKYCCGMEEKEFTSKAHGSSISKKFHIPGRIDMDLCTYIMRQYKLKSYKLGRVAMHFLKQDKADLTIPEMQECVRCKQPERMAKVVEYCIQDTELPILLWEDQFILESIVEMSRVTFVFVQDLFSRGQMFKVISQLFMNGREHGYALTTPPKIDQKTSYKGATVLDIKSGFYTMLAVLDFASLYPSIMKAKNLCYTTLVTDKNYANLEDRGYTYYESKTDLGDNRFQQTIKGLLPIVIDSLLEKRSGAKKLMKKAKKEGNHGLAVIYNARQLALKMSCNSIYGFTGAIHSAYWCPQIASAVTAYGRHLIEHTKIIIEEKYKEHGADVIYGDSVAGDTPVFVRLDGKEQYLEIQNLVDVYEKSHNDKEYAFPNKGIEVWSDDGWTHVKRVIRHKTTKQMYRVLTHTGLVDCTEDHSLLTPFKERVTPGEMKVGQELLHHRLPTPVTTSTHFTTNEAFIVGMFVGDGPFSEDTKSLLAWATKKMNARHHCYCGNTKVVPMAIIGSSVEVRKSFLNGYYAAHANNEETQPSILNKRFDAKSKITAATLYLLVQSLGYHCSINTRSGVYRLTIKPGFRKSSTCIKKIQRLPATHDFVYDLETESHHFSAGVGQMVVHNTDSVMVNFTKIPDTKEGFCKLFVIGEEAAKLISNSFEKAIVLEMEKVYRPAIMQVKKRYAALAFETMSDDGKIDAKGIPVVRRDFCSFQQNVYAAILNVLLYERDLDKALLVMGDGMQQLIDKQVKFDDLVLSRKLAKEYTNQNVMQKVVADKMEKRTPGGGPRSGDRVDFVVVVLPSHHDKSPMYKKVEAAEYALINDMKLDIKYYIKSFQPSMLALFKAFDISHRLSGIFGKYIGQAHRIIHGNATILKFYKPTNIRLEDEPEKEEEKEAEKKVMRTTLFGKKTAKFIKSTKRKQVFKKTTTPKGTAQHRTSIFQPIKKIKSDLLS